MTREWAAVRGRRVATAEGIRPATVVLRKGCVAAVETLDHDVTGAVLDAGESLVFPGLVDTHVHVNDPGRSDWEGFETATDAAAAGGITTIVDMPLNSVPPTISLAGLKAKVEAAQGRCRVDVALWGGCVPASVANRGEALIRMADAGVRGFKAFLCDSGVREFPPVSVDDLRRVAPRLRDLNLPLLVHAEDPEELRPVEGDANSYAAWLASRPQDAEVAAIQGLVGLAAEHDLPIHVVHLASDEALAIIREARNSGLRITAETCPHYLTFSAEEINDRDTRFKCAPPIRGRMTREALWQALMDGDIDQISTDHSPCPPDLKRGHFGSAWGGIASLQLLLPVVWTAARSRGVGIERLVGWLASTPARLAGLEGRKGAIRPGADADFVIWNPDRRLTVDAGRLRHRHPVCAYDGMDLFGVVEHTMMRGRTVFERDEVVGPVRGELLS